MTDIVIISIIFFAVLALIISESKKSTLGRWVSKSIAALSFCALDYYFYNKTQSTYGQAIFISAIFCMVGDVLLIPKNEKSFIAGVFAFLIGHIGFTIAFFDGSANFYPVHALVGFSIIVVSTVLILPKIWGGLSQNLKFPILLYIFVISNMVVCAFSVYPNSKNLLIPLAALTFYFSDMSLSLFKFRDPKPYLGVLCYLLYFGSQVIFAYSIIY